LLEDDGANQRLVVAIGGFHFDKGDFVEDGTKAFYLNAYRAAYFCYEFSLGIGLEFDDSG